MNGYELSRKWFDWAFENPEKISPNHSALYFFAIEHCNRLGWREKFGFPTEMAKDAIGIKSYTTYIKTLNDLVNWGFIIMIERSKNQYSSNIIALSNFDKALDKALDKAIINHVVKQEESTCESIVSINKQLTTKPKTKNKQNEGVFISSNSAYDFLKKEHPTTMETFEMQNKKSFVNYDVFIQNFESKIIEEGIPFESDKLYARLTRLLANWNFKPKNEQSNQNQPVQRIEKRNYF